jgi:hypothetical protein
MENDVQYVGELFRGAGISFTFPNLKNLSSSKITYPQFLACVAQRLLLKQYTAQVLDSKNLLCPMSRTSEIFNENKDSFNTGLNNLFLKSTTLSIINSQTSKNKVTKDEQSSAAEQFVKWYSSYWFDRLKSEEMLTNLETVFTGAEIPSMKPESNDWQILRRLYENAKEDEFFDMIGMESVAFINDADSIKANSFSDVLEASYKFMELSGTVDTPKFEGFASSGDLIVPTTSAFMLSTIHGINEIEARKKSYIPPFDSYNMFYTFRGTSMSNLLKMNQMLFTTYNYMKILL